MQSLWRNDDAEALITHYAARGFARWGGDGEDCADGQPVERAGVHLPASSEPSLHTSS